jgi:hypothetical protein
VCRSKQELKAALADEEDSEDDDDVAMDDLTWMNE